MSAEGKKKRGESGKSKAAAEPFRLNGGGLYPAYMRGILGPDISRQIGKEMFRPDGRRAKALAERTAARRQRRRPLPVAAE